MLIGSSSPARCGTALAAICFYAQGAVLFEMNQPTLTDPFKEWVPQLRPGQQLCRRTCKRLELAEHVAAAPVAQTNQPTGPAASATMHEDVRHVTKPTLHAVYHTATSDPAKIGPGSTPISVREKD